MSSARPFQINFELGAYEKLNNFLDEHLQQITELNTNVEQLWENLSLS